MATRAHCMAVARDPTTGASLLSATVNVYTPGTVTPIGATIFDKNGNTLTNPLTSDAVTGLIDFYLSVAQEVDLVVAKAGYTTRTYSNVPVIDDASFDLTALLTTTGDTPYASSANTPARLPIGSTGQFLDVVGGVPAWTNTIGAGGLTISGTGAGSGVGLQTSGASASRLKLGGTAVVAGDFALSAGWGSTATVVIQQAGSNDSHGEVQVNCSGSGIAANPTITLTFHDGTWTTAPFVIATLVDTTASVLSPVAVSSISATAVILTAYFTPTTAHSYFLQWLAVG